MKSQEITTNVYEVKINNKWKQVRASNMKSLNEWCQINNIAEWRMVGMMSIEQIKKSQALTIVA